MTFDEFIKSNPPDIPSQYSTITDEKGQIVVDFVGRFENLQKDFSYVVKRLGLPTEIALPHLLKTDHEDYQVYYTDQTRRHVREKYCKDVKNFNYQF